MDHDGQDRGEVTNPTQTTDHAPAPITPTAAERRRSSVAMYARESALFAALRPTLLDREGEYVLIKGNELVGIYPTLEEVDEMAVSRFGVEPVFVRQIRRVETPAILNILID